MNVSNQKTWFVTGASKGLGLALVKQLLEDGYNVAATTRNLDALARVVSSGTERFLPLEMDLLSEQSVGDAVTEATRVFGAVDFLVNNAGYGQAGVVEEVSDKEARANFDVNVFGALNVIRAVLPQMRARRSGHIFNISSIAGFTGGFSGWGIYCATKFAMNGFTHALHADVTPLGINVTNIMPGYFRTEFLNRDVMGMPENPIADYAFARDFLKEHQDDIHGNQPGDPNKAAKVMIGASKDPQPPLHLFLGEDAFEMAKNQVELVLEDLKKWETQTRSTQFEAATVS